ncbi:MAG: MBL fold metallo-hydrolase, partial [Gemmobacter sp.]|nr:MBL fold metallo-hydrolase [Gemmobacter sp.]
MTDHGFTFHGQRLHARASGVLWWPEESVLVVGDLHFGKAQRAARHGGGLLPPYDMADTLARLDEEIAALAPATVVCLGDS